ncbi:LOG family protein [Sulfuracidifex metallicus]|uniref:SLOG cluster 4 domain-containing protein n=1 Tax=Sulfuracidifex metallicus TaxID=47303 RepID=UPI002276FBA7|nr:LOG family protein [Sulfuracidifex metallicus]MCY0849718.1 LOG family protein [Sulfuracidifex metallicus]
MFQIAIAAHSSPPSEDLSRKAREFVQFIKGNEVVILLGGYWGLMKIVADEAIKDDIPVIMILPIERNIEVPKEVMRIDSGMEYRARSVPLIRSADAVVALGGGAGTIIEILLAYAMGKPTFILKGNGMSSDLLEKAFPQYVDERNVTKLNFFNDVKELAKHVLSVNGNKDVEERFG